MYRSAHPAPWEEEQSFSDILYDWMQRAPWLALSAAAHLLAFFILAAIPWNELLRKQPVIISTGTEPPPPEDFLEDPIEPPEDVVELPPIEDPVLVDNEVEHVQDTVADETETGDRDFDALAEAPFDDVFTSGELVGGWEALRAWVEGAPQPSATDLQASCEAVVAAGLADGPCRIDPDFVLGDLDDRVPPR